MIIETAINLNELEAILKAHYGYKQVSVKRIYSGTEKENMTNIDFLKGLGGVLDLLLELDDGGEELFNFNMSERISEYMAKQTARIGALELVISDLQKQLSKLNKKIEAQKPVEINPDPNLREEWGLT